ncbi:enoyl-CoA hydratase/carnithine racemase [Endobacter medicaginis]|uniref:Enoyl-CoA hydratase/carnithine racemase n=3 Tax=Endobacter medicaginis TaxID=1181271 RepID=A0A839UV69_9PROT|nr:enoyl-CoA hydratase-related protein [Endobacter medicaginis]MBB3172293.1 enoyl-CoA hydratase/carnithine racemase [Endobacter medicaginis]
MMSGTNVKPATATDEVVVAREGAVMVLTLNRPAAKNALTAPMYERLTGALAEASADAAIRAVLIEGSGGAFSAGNDINDFVRRASAGGQGPVEVLDFLRALVTFEKPVIAAVGGVAVGIGTTLLLHCDLAYAVPEAVFSTPFVRLGLVPEAASSLLLAQRIGPARASAMLLGAESLSAQAAEAAGLVNEVVPAEALAAHARAKAAAIAAFPSQAVAASRRLMRGDLAPVLARIDEEAAIFARAMASPEAREAFAAFLGRKRG